jgi:hypothetical protein
VRRGSLLARFKRPATPQPTTTDSDESSPEPAPASTGTSLVLDWEEAVDLVRARRGDVFEIQFLGREVDRLRASADPAQVAKADDARAHLREVIERKLRGKDLLAPDGRVELVDT